MGNYSDNAWQIVNAIEGGFFDGPTPTHHAAVGHTSDPHIGTRETDLAIFLESGVGEICLEKPSTAVPPCVKAEGVSRATRALREGESKRQESNTLKERSRGKTAQRAHVQACT